jgi:hypothetical protein
MLLLETDAEAADETIAVSSKKRRRWGFFSFWINWRKQPSTTSAGI